MTGMKGMNRWLIGKSNSSVKSRRGNSVFFALLETMYRKDREMDVETAKAIVQRVYNETDEHRSELWQVRMEKTILLVQLKPESR